MNYYYYYYCDDILEISKKNAEKRTIRYSKFSFNIDVIVLIQDLDQETNSFNSRFRSRN